MTENLNSLIKQLEQERGWQIETAHIERLRIIGPYADSQACLHWLFENGYTVKRSGLYTDHEMFPKVDIERFMIDAERELDA